MSGVTTLDIPQNSPEWLAARQSRIGASEIGALACVSPFAGPADVWAAKVGPAQPRGRAELHHLVGHALEGIARDQWRARTGRDAVQGPVIAEVGGLLLASLDTWSRDGREPFEPIDAKVISGANPDKAQWTTDGGAHGEPTIPGAIELQLMQQAHLVERLTNRRLDTAHIAAIHVGHFGFEFRAYRMRLTAERRELYRELAETVPAWWAYYVVGRVPPPEATVQQIAAAVDLDTVSVRPATEEESRLLAAWQATEPTVSAARKALAEAEKIRDSHKVPLARLVGPDTTIPGARWARHGKGTTFKLEKES